MSKSTISSLKGHSVKTASERVLLSEAEPRSVRGVAK